MMKSVLFQRRQSETQHEKILKICMDALLVLFDRAGFWII